VCSAPIQKKFKTRLGATGTLGPWSLSTGVLLLRRQRGSCMTVNDCWGVQMGSTVLHVACQRRREPVALMLVRLNCRTDLEDAVRCFTVFTHLGANCRSSGGVKWVRAALATPKVARSTLGLALSANNPGQVVHTHLPLSCDSGGRGFDSRLHAFSYQP